MWNNWAQAPSWGSLYIIKRPVKPVTGGLPLLCSDVVPLLPLLNDCRCDEGRVCLFTALPLCHCFILFSTFISTRFHASRCFQWGSLLSHHSGPFSHMRVTHCFPFPVIYGRLA